MPQFYLANSNLFINGGDTTGKVKMFDLDNIKVKTDKWERLGMLFDKDVATGFEQMEGKLAFDGPAPDFFSQVAFPWLVTPVVLLGVMTDSSYSSLANNQPFKIEMTIRPKDIGAGKYENQKLTEFERGFMIDKITIYMAGQEMLAIDANNNIYRVSGVDQWASFRSLMGQ